MELHTTVDEVPSGDVGETVPMVLPTIGVGMVPSAAAGINAVGDIMAVLPATDVTAGPGIDGAEMEGGGKAGTAGGGGTGMVEPGSVDMKDVAG